MCGIIGYVGPRECKPLLLQGLERLEYRGYDSAGIALLEDDGLDYVRAVGNLQNLKVAAGPNGSHSTHRARPHALGDPRRRHRGERAPADRLRRRQRSSIVLNGIVENYRELRERAARARATPSAPRPTPRSSSTCSSAHYDGDLATAVAAVYAAARGPFRLRRHPPRPSGRARRLRATRCRSCVGLGEGENFLASNVAAFLRETRLVAVPGRRRRRRITPDGVEYVDPRRRPRRARSIELDWDDEGAEKGGYETFMLKEIYEQPEAVARDDRRPRPPRPARARGPRPRRRGAARAAPDRDPRLRHRLPRGRRRPLRDRGVGPDPGRAGHRVASGSTATR